MKGTETLGSLNILGDSQSLCVSHYYSFIAKFMEHLHSRIPRNDSCDTRKPAHIEIREDLYKGINTKRAVIFLLSNGCEWALKSAHGCTMCGHIAKQTRYDKKISADDYIIQFENAFSCVDFREIPILNIFNNGSFLNDNELPSVARNKILCMIRNNKSIKKLLIESRPEYITKPIVQEMKSLLPDTEIEIAIGLETTDDLRRIISINKGFSLSQFIKAAKIIIKENIDLRSYILLKPPFYSEKEAIDDAVKSIKTAFTLGVKTVSLEAMTYQRYTLIEYLIAHNLYQIPWLWSIIEVVKQTSNYGKVVVGLFKFYPSPDCVPNNCRKCNDLIMEAIVEYNRTLRSEIFDNIHCGCKEDWDKAINNKGDFYTNIDSFIKVAEGEGILSPEPK